MRVLSPKFSVCSKSVAVLIATLFLVVSANAEPWSQTAKDTHNSGHQPFNASVTSLDTLAWENGTGYLTDASSVCILSGTPDKLITWGTNSDQTEVYVHAFRTDSGELAWSSPALEAGLSVSFLSTSTPSADNATNTVYFGTGTKVYCLSGTDGSILWQTPLTEGGSSDIVNGSPTIGGGYVFIPSYGGFAPANKRLYALNKITGTVEWSVQDGGPGSEAPVYAGDGSTTRVFTLLDKGMAAYNPANGALLWTNAAPTDFSTSWTTTASFFGSLSYYDGDLFAATYDFGATNSELLRIDGETGRLEWRASNVINGSSTPNITDGKIIISGDTGYLNPSYVEAYDVVTGSQLWSVQKAASSSMWNVSAVSTSDTIYMTEGTGALGLHLIDPATGNDSATTTTASENAVGTPAIADDGAIYIHHTGGAVASYRADPFPPAALPTVTLEDFDNDQPSGQTDEALIKVLLSGTSADEVRMGESPYTGIWEPFTTSTTYTLSTTRRAVENRTVYVQIRVGTQESPPVSESIQFNNFSSITDWMSFE